MVGVNLPGPVGVKCPDRVSLGIAIESGDFGPQFEVGDQLEVRRSGQPVALLEIVGVDEHAALCRSVLDFLPVQPGDHVFRTSYDEVTVVDDAILLPAPEEPRRLGRIAELARALREDGVRITENLDFSSATAHA